jgi:small subunit ribosomal protein S20
VANHKSAIKRDRQSKVQRLRNAGYKTMAKNAVKELRLAIANEKVEDANQSLKKTVSILQKVQSKGVLHKNTVSRKISRLTRQANKLATIHAEENKEEKSGSLKQDPPSNQS